MIRLEFKPVINCDMGESYGRYTIGADAMLMPYIDSCNIGCGFHGGDPLVIQQTINLAIDHNVKIGAHPSYPDRQGFGRRYMDMQEDELRALVNYQICALEGMVRNQGGKLHHVKPHGALYNTAAVSEKESMAIVNALLSFPDRPILYAPYESILSEMALSSGIIVHHESFIDRRYHANGTLVSRTNPDAVIVDVDQAIRQFVSLVNHQKVETLDQSLIDLPSETFCIHGDNPNALNILKGIKEKTFYE